MFSNIGIRQGMDRIQRDGRKSNGRLTEKLKTTRVILSLR